MKTIKAFTILATLPALGACASYDKQAHDEVGEVLDDAAQILQLVFQGVQMFGGR